MIDSHARLNSRGLSARGLITESDHAVASSLLRLCLAATFIAANLPLCSSCAPSNVDNEIQVSDTTTNNLPQLRPGFDRVTRSITTTSPEAQQWFDQGLQLLYGFDHAAAITAFTQSTKHDPRCAMAWWGAAYAHGPSIDNPRMSKAQSKAAYDAVQKALEHVDHVEPAERALVGALASRYAWPAPQDRKSLDEAFAKAMRQAWLKFPDDPEISVAYADSLMIQQPQEFWTSQGEPITHTRQIITILESTLVDWPSHPGANHYYILAVEGSDDPKRAWRSSSLLQELVPGSGHLVHIASHVFFRMGHYARCADLNHSALESDRAMYEHSNPSDEYRVQMMRHCAALADAAMMEARFETALSASRRIEEIADEAFSTRQLNLIDGLLATKLQAFVRFGKWKEILGEPELSPERIVGRAMRHAARAAAYAANNNAPKARIESAQLDQLINQVTGEWMIGMHKANVILPIARHTLEGQILIAEGKLNEAIKTLQQAASLEDRLVFKSPRGWMVPARHVLGAALLHARRHQDAEAVYRADLVAYPHNGWAMLGLRDALLAQGRDAEAQQFAALVPKAFARSDIQPSASYYFP